ncbi:MAG: response regulator transcription factor [Anaerolineae bacterium]|nr:response regulator transcription factor [Anaerolineae bacterium]MCO5187549.1 response regulator transcription factor [Anaerolineae bacterium]MCO5193353.1 response regulator transcription factor [Anaerolineae bacterium]MCO5198828.1 response regulator transcription factor [Anaerolineae bacterium]MCO5203912.1 response regulator transcription factor [Anaerolineae bacterium]
MKSKVLIVDDDISVTDSIADLLREDGFETLQAHTAEDGLDLALTTEPDLALLDIMIPVMGGLELCQEIRRQSDMPIIFVTALGDVDSVVTGLELGADDYLVKPFQPPVLVARVRAHIRRAQRDREPDDILTFADGDFVINIPARQVTILGESVDLTPREFSLLHVLANNAGRVVTVSDLTEQAWGLEEDDPRRNALKPYIHYLRKKVELDPAAPRWIVTARGVGYRFVDD